MDTILSYIPSCKKSMNGGRARPGHYHNYPLAAAPINNWSLLSGRPDSTRHTSVQAPDTDIKCQENQRNVNLTPLRFATITNFWKSELQITVSILVVENHSHHHCYHWCVKQSWKCTYPHEAQSLLNCCFNLKLAGVKGLKAVLHLNFFLHSGEKQFCTQTFAWLSCCPCWVKCGLWRP